MWLIFKFQLQEAARQGRQLSRLHASAVVFRLTACCRAADEFTTLLIVHKNNPGKGRGVSFLPQNLTMDDGGSRSSMPRFFASFAAFDSVC